MQHWDLNPYDAYPDDRSKNWLRASSKLVMKDGVVVIVFNKEAIENLAETSRKRMHVQNLQEW
jgi:tRNA1(Val) A37 N6-methylase TrmN6